MYNKVTLSRRNLERLIDWGNILAKSEDCNWTKHDSELYFLLTLVLKQKIIKENNIQLKNIL